jgi:hypothetical protein
MTLRIIRSSIELHWLLILAEQILLFTSSYVPQTNVREPCSIKMYSSVFIIGRSCHVTNVTVAAKQSEDSRLRKSED